MSRCVPASQEATAARGSIGAAVIRGLQNASSTVTSQSAKGSCPSWGPDGMANTVLVSAPGNSSRSLSAASAVSSSGSSGSYGEEFRVFFAFYAGAEHAHVQGDSPNAASCDDQAAKRNRAEAPVRDGRRVVSADRSSCLDGPLKPCRPRCRRILRLEARRRRALAGRDSPRPAARHATNRPLEGPRRVPRRR